MVLNRLQHFLTVGETKSISRAAQELHLSQQALSKSIQGIEDDLGYELFERSPKGVNLTPYGCLLFEACQDIRTRWSDAEAELIDLKGLKGKITVVFTPFVERGFITPVVMFFQHYFPLIELEIDTASLSDALENLKDGTLDLVFGGHMDRGETDLDEISSYSIQRFPLAVKMSIDNPLAEEDAITMDDLKSQTVIFEKLEYGEKNFFLQYLKKSEMPNILLVNSQQTIASMVNNNLGITFDLYDADHLDGGRTKRTPFFEEQLKIEVKVSYMRNTPFERIFETLIQYIRNKGNRL